MTFLLAQPPPHLTALRELPYVFVAGILIGTTAAVLKRLIATCRRWCRGRLTRGMTCAAVLTSAMALV